jgi:hypothetical protein
VAHNFFLPVLEVQSSAEAHNFFFLLVPAVQSSAVAHNFFFLLVLVAQSSAVVDTVVKRDRFVAGDNYVVLG